MLTTKHLEELRRDYRPQPGTYTNFNDIKNASSRHQMIRLRALMHARSVSSIKLVQVTA